MHRVPNCSSRDFTREGGKKSGLADPAGVKAMKLIHDIYFGHKVEGTEVDDNMASFSNGKAAMTYCWSWYSGYLIEKVKPGTLDWGMTSLPVPASFPCIRIRARFAFVPGQSLS